MKNMYEYRRLPFCDPQMVCDALMEYEDKGYEIFKLELQPDGKEYLVYIRKPYIIPGATYVITMDKGETFCKGDYFRGMPNNVLRHCRSGIQFEYTLKWKSLLLMINEKTD